MGEQQSQKRGLRSEAQKIDRVREGFDPIPPSRPVAGAFGDNSGDKETDQDLALHRKESRPKNADGTEEGSNTNSPTRRSSRDA